MYRFAALIICLVFAYAILSRAMDRFSTLSLTAQVFGLIPYFFGAWLGGNAHNPSEFGFAIGAFLQFYLPLEILGWFRFRKRWLKSDGFKIMLRWAEQGDPVSQYQLGLMYASANGISLDDQQAASWMRLSAAQAGADAEYQLGLMYANGKGMPKDIGQAEKWFALAASHGQPHAQKVLSKEIVIP